MGDGKVCLYSNPLKQNFEFLEKKGLNLEKCCKCNGNGEAKDCPHVYYISENIKTMRIHELRYLYYHFNVLTPVKS